MKPRLPNPPTALLRNACNFDALIESLSRSVDRVLNRQERATAKITAEELPAELRSA